MSFPPVPFPAGTRSRTFTSRSIPGTRLSQGFSEPKNSTLAPDCQSRWEKLHSWSFSRCHPRAGTVGCAEFHSIRPQSKQGKGPFPRKIVLDPSDLLFFGNTGGDQPGFPREYPTLCPNAFNPLGTGRGFQGCGFEGVALRVWL